MAHEIVICMVMKNKKHYGSRLMWDKGRLENLVRHRNYDILSPYYQE